MAAPFADARFLEGLLFCSATEPRVGDARSPGAFFDEEGSRP